MFSNAAKSSTCEYIKLNMYKQKQPGGNYNSAMPMSSNVTSDKQPITQVRQKVKLHIKISLLFKRCTVVHRAFHNYD